MIDEGRAVVRTAGQWKVLHLASAGALSLSCCVAYAADRPDPNAALLQRLDQLEQRLTAVEAENRELKEQLEFRTERLEKVENRAAKAAQPAVAPGYASVPGDFSFKVRGVIDADAVAFHSREGGYDYNSGTGFRRARLGFEGDAYKDFKWRVEADFAGNAVALQDAYVQFLGIKPWIFTLGQHKTPFGLESNNSDNYNTFIERGIFTNAIGTPGAERRIGFSAQYLGENFTATAGVFGDNESSLRLATSPDESWGVSGRVTWEPISEPGNILHVGATGLWRTELKEGAFSDAVRFSDRPNLRVDGGTFADSGVIRQVDSISYLGAEAVYVRGPFSLNGEYGRATADRYSGLKDIDVDGYYVYASYFLTGESRTFKGGSFDRLKPYQDFDWSKGTPGAWELALRFDSFDFSQTPVVANRGNQGDSTTVALNWYLNPNLKLMFNYVHFAGDNTPLDPVGAKTRADAYALRLHLDW